MARNTFALFRVGQIGGLPAFSVRLESLGALVFPQFLSCPHRRGMQNGFARFLHMMDIGFPQYGAESPKPVQAGVESVAAGSIMRFNLACAIQGWMQASQKVTPVLGK
ncbi:hypothetical protein ACT6QG_13515 [Xanthobacter sp. TB0136]|uniref:hypothetical protein n=1 Tax=Xanthobacter sp. TB0136 TaxID=3459177 RepID=UPI004039D1D7